MQKRQWLKVIFLTFLGLSVGESQAQYIFKTGVHYSTYEETNNQTSAKTEQSEVFFDPTILYEFSNGLLLGANYIFNPVETGSTTEKNTSAYGPTIGYKNGGFFILGTYHISVEEENVSSSSTTTDTGDGMAFDVGYLFEMSGNFHLGVAMKYVMWNFNERETSSGGSSDIDIDLTRLDPYITFAILF